MPALLQICIVIVTLALVVVALLTVRTMTRFLNQATVDISELSVAVRESVAQMDVVTHEAQALVTSLRDCVPPLRRVVDRFEVVGHRTVELSTIVLEELEPPIFAAAAVAHGVRSGANHLLRRLMDRVTRNHNLSDEGVDYE